MKYRFWKLKTNPVRIVKYSFDSININSILFRTSIYTIFWAHIPSKKNVTLVPKLVHTYKVKKKHKKTPNKFSSPTRCFFCFFLDQSKVCLYTCNLIVQTISNRTNALNWWVWESYSQSSRVLKNIIALFIV